MSIREIKSEHPYRGYRRVANILRCVQKVTVNKKRVERVNRTMKEELVWLREWTSPFVFFKELRNWVEEKYNPLYPHSTNGGIPPNVFELNYFNRHITSRSPAA